MSETTKDHTPAVGDNVWVRVMVNGSPADKPYCGTVEAVLPDGRFAVRVILTATPLRMFSVKTRRVYADRDAAKAAK